MFETSVDALDVQFDGLLSDVGSNSATSGSPSGADLGSEVVVPNIDGHPTDPCTNCSLGYSISFRGEVVQSGVIPHDAAGPDGRFVFGTLNKYLTNKVGNYSIITWAVVPGDGLAGDGLAGTSGAFQSECTLSYNPASPLVLINSVHPEISTDSKSGVISTDSDRLTFTFDSCDRSVGQYCEWRLGKAAAAGSDAVDDATWSHVSGNTLTLQDLAMAGETVGYVLQVRRCDGDYGGDDEGDEGRQYYRTTEFSWSVVRPAPSIKFTAVPWVNSNVQSTSSPTARFAVESPTPGIRVVYAHIGSSGRHNVSVGYHPAAAAGDDAERGAVNATSGGQGSGGADSEDGTELVGGGLSWIEALYESADGHGLVGWRNASRTDGTSVHINMAGLKDGNHSIVVVGRQFYPDENPASVHVSLVGDDGWSAPIRFTWNVDTHLAVTSPRLVTKPSVISIHTTAEFAFACSVMVLNYTTTTRSASDELNEMCEYEYQLDGFDVWVPTQPQMVLYHLWQGHHIIQLRSRYGFNANKKIKAPRRHATWRTLPPN